MLLAKLIRNADKLAVIEECYQFDSFGKEKKIGTISPKIQKQFRNHCLLNAKDIITIEDEICYYIAYIFDLNYSESFQLIQKYHLLEPYLNLLDDKMVQNEINLFLKYQNAY